MHPKINLKRLEYLPDAVSLVSNLAGVAVGTTIAATSTLATGGSAAAYAVPAGTAIGKTCGSFLKRILKKIFNRKKDAEYFSSDFLEEIKKKRLVVIFDDVERADMPLPELLGYLNEYVEHLHIPCILLADKDKWEEAQKCQEDKSTLHHLSSTKEKVVGKEFQIQTSFDDVWNFWDLEHNHPVGPRTWGIINKCRDVIRDIITISGVRNYRSLKHVLSDCQRFIGEKSNDSLYIKDYLLNCDELTKLVLSDFICHQYANYIGMLHPKDIPSDLFLYYAGRASAEIAQTDEDDKQKEKAIDRYYEFIKIFDSIPRISDDLHNGVSIKERANDWNCIWKAWLETSFVSSENVMYLMKNSIFFDEKDAHNLNQLITYHSLNDEEASELWKNLAEKFKNREFKNPNFIFTLFFQWLGLAYDGVAGKNVHDLFDEMKKYIQDVTFDGSPFAGEQLPMNHDQLKNDEITKELLGLIAVKCPYAVDDANNAVLNRLYSYMEKPSENDDIPLTIRIEPRFPFEKIDIPRFVDCYTKGAFKEKRVEMCNCIASRFNKMKVDSPEQYEREVTHLMDVEKEIDRMLAQKPILPSKLSLRRLKERIQQIIAV